MAKKLKKTDREECYPRAVSVKGKRFALAPQALSTTTCGLGLCDAVEMNRCLGVLGALAVHRIRARADQNVTF